MINDMTEKLCLQSTVETSGFFSPQNLQVKIEKGYFLLTRTPLLKKIFYTPFKM